MRRLIILVAVFLMLVSPAMAVRSGYSYTDMRIGVRQATVSINSYTLTGTTSHAAVWIDVDDPTLSNWLQVGVIAFGSDGLCAYLEIVADGARTFHCLAPVTLGEQVAVKLTYSQRYGWVAWVNGAAVGSLMLRDAQTEVAAERYGQATLQYSLRAS